MAYEGAVNVLILCHYFTDKSLFHEHDMLDDLTGALRARGFSGQVLTFETKSEVENNSDVVAAVAVQHMEERNWVPLLDNFQVAIGSFEHNVFIFGAESGGTLVDFSIREKQ